jgi:hypothetical protein
MKRWGDWEQPFWLREPLFNALRWSHLKAQIATLKHVAGCLLVSRRFDGIDIVTNVFSSERTSCFKDYYVRRYLYQEF